MADLDDSTFVCPIKEITHLVIDTTCSARLNEHIPRIQDMIRARFGVNYECLFTFDSTSMPRMFVPMRDPARQARAEQMFMVLNEASMHGRAMTSPICFEVPLGGGFASFDIIDVIASIEHCSIYSNVTTLKFLERVMPDRSPVKVLVLGYDAVDD